MGAERRGEGSDRRPLSRFTTPPGRSETPRTSAKSSAGSGQRSEITATTVFPAASAGAISATSPRSGGSSGATTPTTPVGSGGEKDRNGIATGLTPPRTAGSLSAQPA